MLLVTGDDAKILGKESGKKLRMEPVNRTCIFWIQDTSFYFSMYFKQHYDICCPSDSAVSEDAGIEPRTVATVAV